MVSMTDALDRLDRHGRRHKQLRRQADELKPDLHAAIYDAREDAGLKWREIAERAGFNTIQQVRDIHKAEAARRGKAAD